MTRVILYHISGFLNPFEGKFFKEGGGFLRITGIICEYNPLHLGHKKQLNTLQGEDSGVVCLMSGNYVQRGQPALLDKSLRAKAAILCGADLVLELPVTASLSSAEGFAAQGVQILSPFCDTLCFGAETADAEMLQNTAQALLSEEFSAALRSALATGCSFPAARQQALEAMGLNGSILTRPNDILAVEYCKAILTQNSSMTPLPTPRQGCYHDTTPDPVNPSATAVRTLMLEGKPWQAYVPEDARPCFENAVLHTLSAGERSILCKLRTMTDPEFEALPYGSEGLWRKLMHASRQEAALENILAAVKSKRYTRTRLDRMVLCAFLGLTENDLRSPAPYVRVLALNDRGREIVKEARKTGNFPNTGEAQTDPYQAIETRCDDLYGLLALPHPEPPGRDAKRRVSYHTTQKD